VGELVHKIERQYRQHLGNERQALPIFKAVSHQLRIMGRWLSKLQVKIERDVERW